MTISTQLLEAASKVVASLHSNQATSKDGDELQRQVGDFLASNWNSKNPDVDRELGLIVAPYIKFDDEKEVHPLKTIDVTATTPSKRTNTSSLSTSPLTTTTTTAPQSPPINIHLRNNNEDDASSDDDSVDWILPKYVYDGQYHEEEDSDYEEDDNNTNSDDETLVVDNDIPGKSAARTLVRVPVCYYY